MIESPSKAARLHIRASSEQKELLARAARARHVNVSQFVLQTCLEAAQNIVGEQAASETVSIGAQEYDWLMRKLEEPPQELPELRALLREPTEWNG